MNCRFRNNRIKIFLENYISPVFHAAVPPGDEVLSDAGGTITDRYYEFQATNRKTHEKDSIICGMDTAKEFLQMIGHNGLKLFDPWEAPELEETVLQPGSEMNEFSSEIAEKTPENKKEPARLDPTVRQAYYAVNWMMYLWPGSYRLPELKAEILKNTNYIHNGQIKALNTMAGKIGKGMTLSQRILKYSKGRKLKTEVCNFELLAGRLKEIGIESNF